MKKSKINILREKFDFQEKNMSNVDFLKLYYHNKHYWNDDIFTLNIPLIRLGSIYPNKIINYIPFLEYKLDDYWIFDNRK